MTGRTEEALSEARRSIELEPRSPVANHSAGLVSLFARDPDAAIRRFKTAIELNPAYDSARILLAHAYLQAGMEKEAVDEWLRQDLPAAARETLRSAYRSEGRDAFIRRVLELGALQAETPCTKIPFYGASLFAYLGERDRVFECLSETANGGSRIGFMTVEPTFDDLRSDPRYTELLRQIGLGENP